MKRNLKNLDELVPQSEYPHMATSGAAYGDGWFINIVAYTKDSKNPNKNLVIECTMGTTADSTIDSSLYDSSMTHVNNQLVLLRKGRSILGWFNEEGNGFKQLSEKTLAKKMKEIWNLIINADLPREKPLSFFRPAKPFHWRGRD